MVNFLSALLKGLILLSSLEVLSRAAKKTIGTKQTIKAVQSSAAKVVFAAEDAEEHVLAPLLALCKEKNVEVVWVKSMAELGSACGIDVGSASASITEE
ncbi:MAG TPA: 50S ribosomal protein L7Ae-like protein [Clostridia bacterium]|nr:50S ribosomal protein L7Ae-like protein [Clostridia bacterium]